MARSSKRKKRLEFYRSELERARDYRMTQGYEDMWERMIDLYRGRCLPATSNPDDRIVVGIAFGTINVIFPSVSVNYPKIIVQPAMPEDEDRAVITEAVTNYNWRHHDYQDQFRLAVKDYLVIGHGWIKTSWNYREQMVSASPEEMESDYADAVGEADQYAAENPAMAPYVADDAEIRQMIPSQRVIVAEDQPVIERVSPFDMYVDPEATNMDDVRWICQRIVRTLDEVRSDKRYKQSVRLKVEGDAAAERVMEQQRSFFKRGNQHPEDQRVTIYEWYDIKSNTISVCAEGADDFLVDPTPCPFAFGHPFVMLRNYDVPDYFYPIGDLEAIEPLVLELNKTRTISMGVRKKFARKYLYREGAFDAAGRQALESDVDNTYVPVADANTPFTEVIGVVPQTNVPPEIFEHSQQVEDDITTVSGVSEYQRGQIPETRRTATEAAIISDNVNARSADKLAQIEKGISKCARRVVQLQQQFMSQVQVARVVGPDAAIYWVPYSAEDIQGEFDFEVEAGSTQPLNETVRRQEATSFMQAMAPFMGTILDPVAVLQHVLKYGYNIPNPAKFFMPGLAMQQQMAAQQQQQGVGGVGGPQGAPMGGGFMDQNTGEIGNKTPEGAIGGY